MEHLTDQHVTFGKARRAFLLRLCLGFMVLLPSLAHAARLGIPGNGAKLSGVSVISGWKCEAEGDLTIVFNDDGNHIPLLYGTERTDVRANGQCLENDHDNVGFVAIQNWGNLGDGENTAVAYDDGVKFAESTFTVTTPGTDFLRGASKQITVDDFPDPGDTTVLEWNQGTQHFEIVKADLIEDPPASYDRAYWREVRRDIAARTYTSEDFLYASLPALDACIAGTLTQEAKDRALEGMNQIRALHGLADVRYSFLYDTSVQESALIQAANGYLTHHPEPNLECYTEAGDEASGTSNLSGSTINGRGRDQDPVQEMIGWTNDARNLSLVAAAGHRRWILNPFATYMSYGQVYGYAAQKAFGFGREPSVLPAIEVDYVAFPYETYPFTLMSDDPPWSFSVVEDKINFWNNQHPYFDSATVSVARVSDGTSLTVSNLYTDTTGYGVPNFLSWNVAAWEFDTLYQVEINNVAMRNGETRRFSYQVYIDRAGLR